jgi:hypothetical protein
MPKAHPTHPSNQQYNLPPKPHTGIDRFEALVFAVIISCIVIGGALAYTHSNSASQPATPATSVDQSTPYTAPGDTWTTTHTLTGNGIKQTAIFSVSSDWKILYTCTYQDGGQVDGALSVIVYGTDNSPIDVAINATCHTAHDSGETEEHQGGSVYLKVNGTGQWSVTVQELQ